MRNTTRALLCAYVSQVALLNSVPVAANASAITQFTVDPSVEQKLESRMQENSDFLSKINVYGVDELKGELIGLGVTSTIAGRTNTDNIDRPTQDPTGLDNRTYELFQTNFDTHLGYAKLDTWAKFPDFQTRIRDAILKRIALDRIMIGWNGTSAAAQTDRGAHPLLQDVNIGWLQQMRVQNPTRVMSEVVVSSDQVTVGEGGDYATIDALVWDAKQSLLAEWAKEDTELVVIVGSQLLHDKYFPMINRDDDPTEQIARDVIMSTKRMGGLPAMRVPFFPANTVLITRLDNLSIYYQNGKRRRAIIDNPKRNRIENFESSNEGYVIEDLEYACMVENITLLSGD
ncbi:MAG: phage major capsid protein, P2 family [Pseudomonadota bacterium]